MNSSYKFKNNPLPYSDETMEPYIDQKTMQLHHDRHLQTYIDNLNAILSNYPQYQNWTLEKIILNIPSLPNEIQTGVSHNAGGVYNHQFYFSNLANPTSLQPIGVLKEAIQREFGSYAAFQDQFRKAALSVFGSGYAWLVVNASGQLTIITTQNQETPLSQGMWPILNIDVWEHAYYLKHYNERKDYIDDWFHVINWIKANESYSFCRTRFFPGNYVTPGQR